jgi:PadR family transcriptional regulator PadR
MPAVARRRNSVTDTEHRTGQAGDQGETGNSPEPPDASGASRDAPASDPRGGEGVVSGSLRKFQKELNAGIVSLALLALLARAGRPLYGYQIAKELEGYAGGPPVKQGTLYPVLRSLEAGGLLTSEVEPSVAGPPRRYYRVTEEGRQAVGLWQETWEKTSGFVDAVLGGDRD